MMRIQTLKELRIGITVCLLLSGIWPMVSIGQAPDTLQFAKWFDIGMEMQENLEFDSAASYFQKASQGFSATDFPKRALVLSVYYANSLNSLKRYKQSEEILKTFLEASEVHQIDDFTLSLAYNGIGLILLKKQKLLDSSVKFEKAIELMEKSKNTSSEFLLGYYLNYAQSLREMRKFDETIEICKKALSQIPKEEVSYVAFGGIYNTLGSAYMQTLEFEKAKINYEKSLQLFLAAKPINLSRLAVGYHNLGYYHGNTGDYREAAVYYQKALETRANLPKLDSVDLANVYSSLAINYQNVGDQDQARLLHEKAIVLREAKLGVAHFRTGQSYNNLGNTLRDLKELPEALAYHHKALAVWEKVFPPTHSYIGVSNTNIGNCYFDLKSYDKARAYYENGNAIWLNRVGEGHIYLTPGYNNLGLCYFKEGKYDKALEYYYKALKIRLKTYGANHPDVGNEYNLLAEVYVEKKEFEKAAQYIQRGLAAFDKDLDENNYQINPSLHNVQLSPVFLKIINFKGDVFWRKYRQSNNLDDLKIAFSAYQMVETVIDTMRLSFESAKSREKLAPKAAKYFEDAIQASIALFEKTNEEIYLDQAFRFSEKSRAILLYELMKESDALQFAGIPEKLVNREQEIKSELNLLELQIRQENRKGAKKDSLRLDVWEERAFDLKIEMQALIDDLETNYPLYFQLKHQLPVSSISELKAKSSKDNSLILEYFMGSEKGFVFGILGDKTIIHSFDIDSTFNHHLDAFLENLNNGKQVELKAGNTAFYQAFANQGHYLYQKILAPVLSELLPLETQNADTTPSLLIIPDGKLGYLPFEILLSRPFTSSTNYPDYSSLPYLINQFNIRYEYSGTLLLKQSEIQSKAGKTYAGFAPSFESSRSITSAVSERNNLYAPLSFNQEEVTLASGIFSGKAYLNRKATKEAFLSKGSDFRILHLATHALVDDKAPMLSRLVFSNDSLQMDYDFLYAYELYNMKLNAELVVLSACNTGSGKLTRGEGIMSLARSFKYAGSPNIVMSLWQAEDQSAKQIMELFFTHLDAGLSKDKALRKAKIDFLSTSPQTHPFFWSSFVLIGDNTPIEPMTNLSWLWIMLMIFVIAGTSYYYYSARK